MKTKKWYQKHNRRLLPLTLAMSLFVHVAGYLGYLAFQKPQQPLIEESTRVTVQLDQLSIDDVEVIEEPVKEQIPEPVAEVEAPAEPVLEVATEESMPESHAPVDNSDQFASDNQQNREAKEVVAGSNDPSQTDFTPDEAQSDPVEDKDFQTALGPKDSPDSGSKEVELEGEREGEAEIGEEEAVPDVAEIKPESKPAESESGAEDTARPKNIVSSRKGLWDSASGAAQNEKASLEDLIAKFEQVDQLSVGSPSGLNGARDEDVSASTDTEPDISLEFLNSFGNLELLSESGLREAEVQQPFSERESKELELANRYLARMNQQVRKRWVNPYRGGRMYRGIIRVELNVQGFLENVYVYRASGLSTLDESVIQAIKSVPRFMVPKNEVVAKRYYTQMSFHYSSIEPETELMPFETELAKKEDS